MKYARKHKTRKTSNEVEWLSIMWRHIFPLCWNRSRQPVSYPVFLLSIWTLYSLIADLTRVKRAQRSPVVKKMWWTTHPRKFGIQVSVHRPTDRPSVRTTSIPIQNNSFNRYGNPNVTRSYFDGKWHSHPRLVKQRQLLRVNKDENGKRKLFLNPCFLKY